MPRLICCRDRRESRSRRIFFFVSACINVLNVFRFSDRPINRAPRTSTRRCKQSMQAMSIEGIYITSEASNPMESLEKATLIAGKGIQGDRYCNHVGTYSHIRVSKLHPWQREPGRQLTILSADSVEYALKQHGLDVPTSLGDLRRNIVVRGISAQELLGAVGHIVNLGETCRVLVHRLCVPCMYNERKNCIPGMMEAIWNEAGVSCQVVVGGDISVGDSITLTNEQGIVDDGNQPPGYYTPPSKRTSEMVLGAMRVAREQKKQLQEIDPEGVKRVEASYATVGLTFWPKDKE